MHMCMSIRAVCGLPCTVGRHGQGVVSAVWHAAPWFHATVFTCMCVVCTCFLCVSQAATQVRSNSPSQAVSPWCSTSVAVPPATPTHRHSRHQAPQPPPLAQAQPQPLRATATLPLRAAHRTGMAVVVRWMCTSTCQGVAVRWQRARWTAATSHGSCPCCNGALGARDDMAWTLHGIDGQLASCLLCWTFAVIHML